MAQSGTPVRIPVNELRPPNGGTTAIFPPDVALPQRYVVARERVEGALALNDLTAVSGQHILAIYSS